jgi:adenosine deaminase
MFLDAGIPATINTDDPGISGIDLPYEYNLASPRAGLTNQQIHQAQVNGLEVAFLTGEERQALRDRSLSHLTHANLHNNLPPQ